jgi:hypothetical protein
MAHFFKGGKKTPDERAAVNEKDSEAKRASRESLIYFTVCPDIISHCHNVSCTGKGLYGDMADAIRAQMLQRPAMKPPRIMKKHSGVKVTEKAHARKCCNCPGDQTACSFPPFAY